jgi:hypothetical protein
VLDKFVASIMNCEPYWFRQDSFQYHQSQYGHGYIADYQRAISFGPKAWLKLHYDMTNLIDYSGPNPDLYFPMSLLGDLDKHSKFLAYLNLSNGLFPACFLRQSTNMEFELHHINQEEDKIICLPTDIHGGFSDILHSRCRKLPNRKQFDFLKPYLYTGLGKLGLQIYSKKHPADYPNLHKLLKGELTTKPHYLHSSFSSFKLTDLQLEHNQFTTLYSSIANLEMFTHHI